ncbi:M24 family metallopeptidase [Halomicrobium salinisoli]|uniref:M24 family metallopeptidase n=1 Tax=Halomicrobium salinisoli TaxID=2878391 RepID=UPI001CF0CAF0|nr:aminopeptidase P family protein [Halomicrobium salinisoli]
MAVTERLDAYLSENGLEAVWFARPNSFAWLTGGGDNVVDRAGDVGVAAAGYDGDGLTVVTDNIEAPRLRDEELPADAAVETVQWYEDGLAAAVERVSPTPAAADFDVPGLESVDASALRQPLTDEQIEQYRSLSADVAAAVESVARECDPDDTEIQVAADLRRAIEAAGAGTPVVLVGSAERAQRYRHYTPKDAELGEYALLSVTADRDGLYASTTRTVAFDAPDWLDERTRDAMRVEATALAATREGGTAGDVFEAVQDAYADLGWEGEWRNHHQGGAAGFAGREWIATPDNDAPVELPMGYAWNPTVQGAKSEDLHLVDGDGVELLTATGEWPTREVSAVGYDLTLDRHAVLSR